MMSIPVAPNTNLQTGVSHAGKGVRGEQGLDGQPGPKGAPGPPGHAGKMGPRHKADKVKDFEAGAKKFVPVSMIGLLGLVNVIVCVITYCWARGQIQRQKELLEQQEQQEKAWTQAQRADPEAEGAAGAAGAAGEGL